MRQIDYDTMVNLLMYAGRDDILVAKPAPIAAMPAPEIRKLGNEGAVFFLPEEELVQQETETENAALSQQQQETEAKVAALSQQKKMQAPPQKKKKPVKEDEIDEGKLKALHEDGRSVAWIADEMKISKQTVYNHLKKMKEMEEKDDANEDQQAGNRERKAD